MRVKTDSETFSVSSPAQCFCSESPFPGICSICFRDDLGIVRTLSGRYAFHEYFHLRDRLALALLFRRKTFTV